MQQLINICLRDIAMNKENFNFDEALKEIEEIVVFLESGKVSLEESLALYERGVKLVREANAVLSEAKCKLIKVSGVGSDD